MINSGGIKSGYRLNAAKNSSGSKKDHGRYDLQYAQLVIIYFY